jgi:hypothetical protein
MLEPDPFCVKALRANQAGLRELMKPISNGFSRTVFGLAGIAIGIGIAIAIAIGSRKSRIPIAIAIPIAISARRVLSLESA